MARKGSLISNMKAAADKVVGTEEDGPAPMHPGGDMTTTAVHLPKSTLSLLRRVAMARADRIRGRPSVSAVLVDLAERARAELERELP